MSDAARSRLIPDVDFDAEGKQAWAPGCAAIFEDAPPPFSALPSFLRPSRLSAAAAAEARCAHPALLPNAAPGSATAAPSALTMCARMGAKARCTITSSESTSICRLLHFIGMPSVSWPELPSQWLLLCA
jgi:hypothetical protein